MTSSTTDAARIIGNNPRKRQEIGIVPRDGKEAHSGKIRAHGPIIESVLEELDSKGLSRQNAIVKFISAKPGVLILF